MCTHTHARAHTHTYIYFIYTYSIMFFEYIHIQNNTYTFICKIFLMNNHKCALYKNTLFLGFHLTSYMLHPFIGTSLKCLLREN